MDSISSVDNFRYYTNTSEPKITENKNKENEAMLWQDVAAQEVSDNIDKFLETFKA